MRSQGASQELVDTIATGKLRGARLSEKERTLLEFIKVLTLEPAAMNDELVDAMRKAGWSDEQIWEAAVEVSIFSFLNRMADLYGLDYPAGGWLPPGERR